MPTFILNGPVNQFGPGKKVCTFTGGTLLHPAMKQGPDGSNWALLSPNEVIDLSIAQPRFQHVPPHHIDHVCAQKSGWAFRVFDSSSPHGVAFLHIQPPAALVERMGEDPNILEFSGADILRCYLHAADGSRSPRLWRRHMPNWDEIAVNFCINHVA
ncbi:hypothetical protein Q4S45_08705 [Massilia sp. R2A-15]|uniref:hypothetical protein n=1 Tax=Massilia sp. R2A-15 TaxID=3064278 RepID=UPI002732EC55|nr:hypothetical protein [Massilia sp. R2A-15]WLI91182.1 hypothetical protein Q4S45_08705 [Massilia sp. R2A-15]